jgi:PAS domain-containing protein
MIGMAERESLFQELAKGMSELAGEDRISGIVLNLGRFFDVALIATHDETQPEAPLHVLRASFQAGLLDLNPYPFADSICQKAMRDGIVFVPEQAMDIFPKDPCIQRTEATACLFFSLKDSRGKPVGVIGIMQQQAMQDEELAMEVLSLFVSPATAELERISHERELQEQRALVKDLADSIPGAIFQLRINQHSRQMKVLSSGATQLWERSAEFVRNAFSGDLAVIIHPEDAGAFEDTLNWAAHNQQGIDTLFRIHKPESPLWLRATAQYRPGKNGDAVFTGVFTNVTELKNTQRDLELSRRVSDLEAAVLDSINRHQTVIESADTLVRGVESIWPHAHCIIRLPNDPSFPQDWSYPSIVDQTHLLPLPKIPQAVLEYKKPQFWEDLDSSVWGDWSSLIEAMGWQQAATCIITGVKTPEGGVVLVFHRQPTGLPVEKQLQKVRRFAYSASLVQRYGRRNPQQ